MKSDVGKTELKEPDPHRLADFSVLLFASLTSKHVLEFTLKDIVTLPPLMVTLLSVIVGGGELQPVVLYVCPLGHMQVLLVPNDAPDAHVHGLDDVLASLSAHV